jgi:hypothetical protein
MEEMVGRWGIVAGERGMSRKKIPAIQTPPS